MKKATVSISYDDEKLNALKMFLSKKNKDLDQELTGFVEKLYNRYVSDDVKEYIAGRYGNDSDQKT